VSDAVDLGAPVGGGDGEETDDGRAPVKEDGAVVKPDEEEAVDRAEA